MNSNQPKTRPAGAPQQAPATTPFRVAAPAGQAPRAAQRPAQPMTAIEAAQGGRALPRTVLPTSRKAQLPVPTEPAAVSMAGPIAAKVQAARTQRRAQAPAEEAQVDYMPQPQAPLQPRQPQNQQQPVVQAQRPRQTMAQPQQQPMAHQPQAQPMARQAQAQPVAHQPQAQPVARQAQVQPQPQPQPQPAMQATRPAALPTTRKTVVPAAAPEAPAQFQQRPPAAAAPQRRPVAPPAPQAVPMQPRGLPVPAAEPVRRAAAQALQPISANAETANTPAPLTWQPRPIGKDRKKMVESVLRHAAQDCPHSPLPAPRKSITEVEVEAMDPFESNFDGAPMGFGQMLTAPAAPTPVPAPAPVPRTRPQPVAARQPAPAAPAPVQTPQPAYRKAAQTPVSLQAPAPVSVPVPVPAPAPAPVVAPKATPFTVAAKPAAAAPTAAPRAMAVAVAQPAPLPQPAITPEPRYRAEPAPVVRPKLPVADPANVITRVKAAAPNQVSLPAPQPVSMPIMKKRQSTTSSFGDIRTMGQELPPEINGTAQDDDSLAEMAKRPVEPARFNSNRVRFNCPCCYHGISLPRRLAGNKTRCPQCDSAIRAPHPKRRLGAYSYERDIESLLHPDRFPTGSSLRPSLLGVPLPTGQQVLMGGAAILMVTGGGETLRWINSIKTPATAPAAIESPTAPRPVSKKSADELRDRAEIQVRSFMKADGWKAKAAFIRDPERVGPLMEDYYSKNEGGPAIEPEKVVSDSLGFYSSQAMKDPICMVKVKLPNGDIRSFRVEFADEAPMIEWEASVAYNAKSWDEIVADEANPEPQQLRVAAALDNYFNHQFSDRQEYISVCLIDPVTKNPLGNGYLQRRSMDARRLIEFLRNSTKRAPEQLIVKVRPVTMGKDRRMVEITEFVKGGFREAQNQKPEAVVLTKATVSQPSTTRAARNHTLE